MTHYKSGTYSPIYFVREIESFKIHVIICAIKQFGIPELANDLTTSYISPVSQFSVN